jgi:hypothetical protein
MKDLRQLSEEGYSSRFAFLNQASFARWAPIPLRLIVGYGFMQHGFALPCLPRGARPQWFRADGDRRVSQEEGVAAFRSRAGCDVRASSS